MRRICFVAFVVMTAAALVPAAPAVAATSFTFYGSGDGHGIGLSQWGANGLASAGWSHGQILTHFFRGTSVQTGVKVPSRIKVGLTVDEQTVHLKAAHGSVRLWVGSPLTGTAIGTIPPRATWTVRAATNGGYKVFNAAGANVGGGTWGSTSQYLYATYADSGSRVFVPEADQIYGTGFTYAHGFLEFNTYSAGGCCVERLILRIPFEQYLLGIGEVPSSWPMQALETQVDAARTYAAYDVQHYGVRASCNCHVTDGANDQTYVGWSKESGTDGNRWVAAVQHTAHEVVTYQGAVIQSFFAASDGGHSENVEDAWHGGDPRYAIPYLRGVCDPGESLSTSPWVSWQYSFSPADVTSRLHPYTGSIGAITGFSGDVRGVSGRIITIVATGTTGHATVTGSELRAAMGLPDDRVWVNSDRNILGAIRALYDRIDCRPGIPTSTELVLATGSRQLFANGGIYRNTRVDLLTYLRGLIYDEYQAVGDATGVLGLPASSVVKLSARAVAGGCTGCARVDFDGGGIYRNPATGAHALWGPVLTTYLGAGGPGGSLGYPTDRVQTAPDGSTSAPFEHGSISCSAAGSCSVS